MKRAAPRATRIWVRMPAARPSFSLNQPIKPPSRKASRRLPVIIKSDIENNYSLVWLDLQLVVGGGLEGRIERVPGRINLFAGHLRLKQFIGQLFDIEFFAEQFFRFLDKKQFIEPVDQQFIQVISFDLDVKRLIW